MNYVIYHNNCPDGFASAFACDQFFKLNSNPVSFQEQTISVLNLNANCTANRHGVYIPMQYGQPFPNIPEGSKVYIVDFSFSKDIMIELDSKYDLTVIDHHKTSVESLRGLKNAIHDMEHSGAVLTYMHLFNVPADQVPMIYKYVEDRDLWRFDLPKSKAVNAMISVLPKSFESWDLAADMIDKNFEEAVFKGMFVLEIERLNVSRAVEQSFCAMTNPIMIDKELGIAKQYYAAFCSTTFSQSEVGNNLLVQYPEAEIACVFVVGKDGVRASFRSRSSDDVDCSKVAAAFGGGGHKNAAGATNIPIHVFEKTLLSFKDDFDVYQDAAKLTAIHNAGLSYSVAGLASEAGEVAGVYKKMIRDEGFIPLHNSIISDENQAKFMAELGDVLWYVSDCATNVGLTLSQIAKYNISKLMRRSVNKTLKGSGDNR